ncbi:dTDP-4-dehydrorhamnose 3,5-epimerase family protein [Candidatus Curtissbacteria bacterium]|nr:dTDP-4-dehydrorhamnose 3,5-epimerase family protein [Candidatus Curtissbacteria bacterium]
MQTYKNLNNLENLIEGVVVRQLKVHKDASGTLFETLRNDWGDVYGDINAPFAMQYMSQTPPGLARDEDEWHVHKNQKDRFVCISGKIVTAIYDPREDSKTKGELNLFEMSPDAEEQMYMVVIPEETYHGFMVVSQIPGMLLNFPTQLYTGEDEGRVKHAGEFNWQDVRNDFGIK